MVAVLLRLLSPHATFAAESPPSFEEILQAPTVTDLHLSPDGTQVAYSVQTQSAQTVYAMALGDRVTRSIGTGGSPSWAPDSLRLAFIAPSEEGRQIWLSEGDTPPRQITRLTRGLVDYQWSPDGRSIAFTSQTDGSRPANEPIVHGVNDVPFRRLWVHDVDSGKTRAVTAEGYSVGGYDQWFLDSFSWSPDSTRIAFTHRPHAAVGSHLHGEVAVIDVRTDEMKLVVNRMGMDAYPTWSPDGRSIAFITTDGRHDWVTASHLDLVEVATGKIVRLSNGFDEKIKDHYWSGDGRHIFFIAWQGVTSQIFQVDVAARAVAPISSGSFEHSKLSVATNGTLAFLRENSESPPEIYVTRAGEFSPRRITHTADARKSWPVITSRVLRWPSFDGLTIEGIVSLPPGFKTGQRYPLLLALHGGPHAAEHDNFLGAALRRYVNAGWIVFRPNFRGSGGYGERFMRANLNGWGVGDYADVMAGVDQLIADGLVDGERMAVYGASYGGYLSTWTITQTKRFKAAIIGCAIVDVPSFLRTTDTPERFESYLGTDERLYARHSPSTYFDRVVTPTLVWHGTDDLRVPTSQGRYLYTALLKNRTPVEYIVYPNTAHGLTNPKWQADLARRSEQWLNKHVLGVEQQ